MSNSQSESAANEAKPSSHPFTAGGRQSAGTAPEALAHEQTHAERFVDERASAEQAAPLLAHWADADGTTEGASTQAHAAAVHPSTDHLEPRAESRKAHIAAGHEEHHSSDEEHEDGEHSAPGAAAHGGASSRPKGHQAAKSKGHKPLSKKEKRAADRKKAASELADRFQIVGKDYEGPRRPNTVTKAEYQRIVNIYSDIRSGYGDLTIASSADQTKDERAAYRRGVMRDIAALMQTESGRHEIEHLHNNVLRDENGKARKNRKGKTIHRHTTITPLLDQNGNLDRTNGYASPDGVGAKRSVNPDGSLGKAGKGTNVHIRYNPGVNVGDSAPQLQATNPWFGQMRSDILLAHEMNHAIKQTQGMVDPRAVQATDNANNPADPDMAQDANFRWPQARGGGPLTRVEHQAAGLGLYANDDMTENAYRRERRQLADQNGVGQIQGDGALVQRNSYTFRPQQPPAPPPGPAPAPGPTPVAPPGPWHNVD